MSNGNTEELVYDAVIELFDLSSYSSTLQIDAKERYLSELNEVRCDCPYSIENGYWTSHKELEHVLPSVEFGDIWHYFVYRNNFYTAGEMKNYKSSKSYKILVGEG